MNRHAIFEMTSERVNPAVRKIDARKVNPRKPASFAAATAAWQRRAAEMASGRYEKVLQMIRDGMTANEIAAKLNLSRSGVDNFILRHHLPRPISEWQKRRTKKEAGK